MATDALQRLQTSLESAIAVASDVKDISPPENGISLLDVKSELFISYLQNLTFLLLLKIRHYKSAKITGHAGFDSNLIQDVTQKLAELRVYLDKGVRPLESRLKYQIDKVLRTAESAERLTAERQRSATRHLPTNGANEGEDSDSAEDSNEVDELSYRPNPAAFARPSSTTASAGDDQASSKPGIYKPPRITPTALPSTFSDRRESSQRRPQRSSAVDEYISSEMSMAPVTEPSIGSTILRSGRGNKSNKDREKDAEKAAYEEANFVRLPNQGGKKKGRRDGGFGGEDFHGLGEGLDRIERLTGKRKKLTEDGPRGEGFDATRKRRRR